MPARENDATSQGGLIEEAERLGLWIRSPYQDLWWSPAELRREQAEGRFRWADENFELRDPAARLRRLELKAADARLEYEDFEARMERARRA